MSCLPFQTDITLLNQFNSSLFEGRKEVVFCSPQGPALECRSGGNLGVNQSDISYIYGGYTSGQSGLYHLHGRVFTIEVSRLVGTCIYVPYLRTRRNRLHQFALGPFLPAQSRCGVHAEWTFQLDGCAFNDVR